MLRIIIFFIFFLQITITVSCTYNNDSIIVKATAKKYINSNGKETILTYVDEQAAFERDITDLFILQNKYPQLRLPEKSKLYKVSEVISDDLIILSDGTKLQLAGILAPRNNDPEINNYISIKYKIQAQRVSYFSNTKNSFLYTIKRDEDVVSFIEHSKECNGIIIGYLYTVDYSIMNDPEIKDIATGPSISCVNETLVSSGYAVVDTEFEHKFSQKYLILQEMAKKAKINLWAKPAGRP